MKAFISFLFLLFNCPLLFSQDFIESQPVGGKYQLDYFIDQELVYPEEMYDKGIEGKVFFLFDIDEKGHPSNFRDISSPHENALTEVMRIFELIEWIPATHRGYPTKDTKHFEIEFNVKKYNRLCKTRGYKTVLNPFEPIDSSNIIHWYRTLDEAPHPIFIEKNQNLASYIATNLKYPELAIRQNVTGVVKLNFVVEANGKISNLTIVNSVGAGCNEEAIRILRSLKWMPGILNGKAVRTRTSLSISFSLDPANNGLFNPVVKSSYGG